MNDTVTIYTYLQMLGNRLQGFKQSSKNVYNFRCPICGDSEKNSNKKRGYIYLKDGDWIFHCHNCGKTYSFLKFLWEVDPDLYREYREETTLGKLRKKDNEDKIDVKLMKQSKPLPKKENEYIVSVDKLDFEHPAVQYLKSRGVPTESYNKVYWTDNYSDLIKNTFGEKYKDRNLPSSGIVFPLYNVDKELMGYQYRTIDKDAPKAKRFVTCTENKEQVFFGIEHLDTSKPVYVVEGPIDSLFIPNCVAVLTSSTWRAKLQDAVYVNDSEPRNKDVCKQIKKCIDLGYKTVILPNEYESLDINEIVQKYGLTTDELMVILNNNTYSGIKAKMVFSEWHK